MNQQGKELLEAFRNMNDESQDIMVECAKLNAAHPITRRRPNLRLVVSGNSMQSPIQH